MRKNGKRPSQRSGKARASERSFATTITIDGSLDSHTLEALQLELRRLADACGLKLETIEVETHDV